MGDKDEELFKLQQQFETHIKCEICNGMREVFMIDPVHKDSKGTWLVCLNCNGTGKVKQSNN